MATHKVIGSFAAYYEASDELGVVRAEDLQWQPRTHFDSEVGNKFYAAFESLVAPVQYAVTATQSPQAHLDLIRQLLNLASEVNLLLRRMGLAFTRT